jgi:hypothetical protein
VSITAFEGPRVIACGDLSSVTRAAKAVRGTVLAFDDETGAQVDLDFREAAPEPPRPVGRPKLGVVAREVTLLPRHWEWLNRQPGGASVALRKLVEEARRAGEQKDRVRHAQEAAYKFMLAMAGNEPGYEEALRALFAGKKEQFEQQIACWPDDVRDYARRLAGDAF